MVCVCVEGGGVPEGGFSQQFCNRILKNNTAVWKEVFSCSSNRNTCAYPIPSFLPLKRELKPFSVEMISIDWHANQRHLCMLKRAELRNSPVY